MTPYAISLNPRHARGGERRPIDNVDGEGLALRSLIDSELKRLKGDNLIPDREDDSKSVRVTRIYEYDQFTFVEFGVGRAGYVGTLHQIGGGRVAYTAEEHNESLIRGLFVYPAGAHEVYWLSERAGNNTVFSHVEALLLKKLRDALDLTVRIEAVADWAAIRAWSQNVVVQEIRFDAPRGGGGSTQAIDVNGIHGDVRVTVKPRGLALNRVVRDGGPDRELVFGFLANVPLISENGITASDVIGQGWRAHVAFKNPAGRQRSFGLATDESGPTLVYQVGSVGGGRSRAYRPSDHEFAETCESFLADISGKLPIDATVGADILTRLP